MLCARASQHSLNLHGLPATAARRRDAALVQRICDPSRARDPLSADRVDDGNEVGGSGCGLRPPSLGPFPPPQLGVLKVLHPAAEFHAPRLRRSERCLGSLRDCAPLLFGDHRHDANCEPVCVRHVRRRECDTGALEPEQEVRVAGEPIELRDDQRPLPQPTFGQGSRKLRAIIPFAAFDLDEFRQGYRTEAGKVGGDRCALRLDAEPCLSVETRR
jgi:hypothetical protein